MAQDQSALHDLLEVLRTAEGGQFVNRLLAGALQALIELEATAAIGAAPHRPGAARGDLRGVRARVSTRKVDDVVAAMGVLAGVSTSEVSRICAALDAEVAAFAVL